LILKIAFLIFVISIGKYQKNIHPDANGYASK
jgi:hypothetical protein